MKLILGSSRGPSVGNCHIEIAVGEGGRWAAARS
jgi:hypothetical protein